MNNELRRELKVAKLWYYNFRYSIYFPVVLPTSAILICVIIIFLFIVPQIQNFFSLQDEIQATSQRIQTLKDNINFLRIADAQAIDKDFQVAALALPQDKEFIGILNAIADAAATSNVAVQDYTFTPAIAAMQTLDKSGSLNASKGMTPIQISLVVQGAVPSVNEFVRGIEKRLPLAEVKEVDFNANKAQVVISFYTKPFPDVKLSNEQSINVLTKKDKELLQKLRTQSSTN